MEGVGSSNSRIVKSSAYYKLCEKVASILSENIERTNGWIIELFFENIVQIQLFGIFEFDDVFLDGVPDGGIEVGCFLIDVILEAS